MDKKNSLLMTNLSAKPKKTTPSWAGVMKTGHWYRISGDKPDLGLAPTPSGTRYLEDGDPAKDVRLNPSRSLEMRARRLLGRYAKAPWSGRCDFWAITETWNGAVFADYFGDSGSMVIFGGGHNDYFGSDVHAFNLATRQWSRISDGYVSGKVNEYGAGAIYADGCYPDGSPLPPHTYGYVQYDPVANDYILFKGQRQLGPEVEPIAIPHMLNLDTLRWRRGPKHPDAELKSGGWTAWDPKRRILWGNSGDDGNTFIGYSPDGQNKDGTFGSWGACQASKLPNSADHNAMAYDPAQDRLIIAEHKKSRLLSINPAALDEPIRSLISCPTTAMHPYASLEYAPTMNALIYCSAANAGELFCIRKDGSSNIADPNRATCSWEGITAATNQLNPITDAAKTSQHPTNLKQTFGRFRVASYDGVDIGILIRHIDSPVYAIKLPC
tara:strand:- start:575 stop:1894 length:1320 start_codon:yes stop_codon:yes gene_type:complete